MMKKLMPLWFIRSAFSNFLIWPPYTFFFSQHFMFSNFLTIALFPSETRWYRSIPGHPGLVTVAKFNPAHALAFRSWTLTRLSVHPAEGKSKHNIPTLLFPSLYQRNFSWHFVFWTFFVAIFFLLKHGYSGLITATRLPVWCP